MLKFSNTTTRGRACARRLAVRLALAALAALACAGREAAAQTSTLVSANASNTAAGSGASYLQNLSADGRYVAFQSNAPDLVPNDNNNTEDVFVRDMQTGAVTLVSVNREGTGSCARGAGAGPMSPDGRFVLFVSNCTDLTTIPNPAASPFAAQVYVRDLALQKTTLVSVNGAGTAGGNHNSLTPVITPDGRFVAFVSVASDLTPLADANGTVDVFLRDLQTNTTELLSVNASGTGAGNRGSSSAAVGYVTDPVMSADGRFVAFNTHATNLTALPDTNDSVDVVVRDAVADKTSLLSVNKTGDAAGRGVSEHPQMSADGRLIIFWSTSNDLTAATEGRGASDLFLRDTQAGTTTLVSVTLDGRPGGGGPGRITPDGRYVVFSSGSNNMAAGVNDTSVHLDVFLRDLQTNTTTLVSYNRWGTRPGDEDSHNAVVSDDGRFVAFQGEAANLTEETDYYGSNDVFVRDMASGLTRMVSVNRTGAAAGNRGSVFPHISGGGARVAFDSSATDLTALADANSSNDVFAYAVPQALAEPSFIQFTADYSGRESDGPVFVTVTRTGDLSAPATVEYATFDGTASDRTDYAAALGTLRFAAGVGVAHFEVIINDDPFVEGQEEFTIRLSAPYRARLGARSSATVSVISNDAAPEGTLNYLDDTFLFVRQHYRDFLNREPDDSGHAFWVGEIEQCGADAACREVKRVNVSAAFFLSIEFQQTGYFVYRVRMLAGGQSRGPSNPVPITLRDFLHDVREVSRGVVVGEPGWQQRLEANKQAYVEDLVRREWFADTFPVWMNGGSFVSKLNDGSNRQLPSATTNDLAGRLSRGEITRAQALRAAAEDPTFARLEFNRAFVLMQYFGYLRRNPNDAPEPGLNFDGYNFWLGKLNQFNGNYIDAEMVKAFVTSIEYRRRFGQP